MKQKRMPIGLPPRARMLCVLCALCILSALSGCQTPPPAANANTATTTGSPGATTAKPDPKVLEEVKELLAKHDKALNDKSLDAVMATFSFNPNTVVLGTGQGERFVGTQAIKDAYTEIFKDYDTGTLVSNCDWKTGGADGMMAWLAATCQMSDSMKGVKRDYELNVSAAVEKQAGQWRFVMLHMSNATTNGPPPAAGASPTEKAK
jgi:ketosteroid isomerase-like protein